MQLAPSLRNVSVIYTVCPGGYSAASVVTVVEKLDQLQAGGSCSVVVVVAGGGGGTTGPPFGGAAGVPLPLVLLDVVVVVVGAVVDVVSKIAGFVTGSLGAADLEA